MFTARSAASGAIENCGWRKTLFNRLHFSLEHDLVTEVFGSLCRYGSWAEKQRGFNIEETDCVSGQIGVVSTQFGPMLTSAIRGTVMEWKGSTQFSINCLIFCAALGASAEGASKTSSS